MQTKTDYAWACGLVSTCRGAPGDKFDKKSWFHNKGSKIGHVTEVDKEDLFLESSIWHLTLDNFFHCRGGLG